MRRCRTRNLYNLLSAVQSKAATGTPSGYVLFKPVTVTTGTGKKKKTKTVYVIAARRAAATAARSPRFIATRRPATPACSTPTAARCPTGWKVLKVPPRTIVVTCNRRAPRRSARATEPNGVPPGQQVRLLPLQARRLSRRPVRDRRQVPEHDGQGPEAVGRPAGLRPERPADRAARVHGQGQQGRSSR